MCWGHGTVTKVGNAVYGVLCGSAPSQPGALSEANKQSYKRQVQIAVPELSFSLLWSFFNEQLLLPSSLLTPLQHLQEVNDQAKGSWGSAHILGVTKCFLLLKLTEEIYLQSCLL